MKRENDSGAHERVGRVVALLESSRLGRGRPSGLLLEESALHHLPVALARETMRVRLLSSELVLSSRAAREQFTLRFETSGKARSLVVMNQEAPLHAGLGVSQELTRRPTQRLS